MDFIVEWLKCVKIKIVIKWLHKECGHNVFVCVMMWKIVLNIKCNHRVEGLFFCYFITDAV